MSRHTRTRGPRQPGDVARREFKELVDSLVRRFMQEFSHAVPDTAEGKATLLRVLGQRMTEHAQSAPATPPRSVP